MKSKGNFTTYLTYIFNFKSLYSGKYLEKLPLLVLNDLQNVHDPKRTRRLKKQLILKLNKNFRRNPNMTPTEYHKDPDLTI